MKFFWWALCIISLGYYLVIISYAGLQATFSRFWLLLGGIFLVLGLLCSWSQRRGIALLTLFPVWAKISAGLLAGFCLLLFLGAAGCIASGMCRLPPGNLDYIIVLGAKVKGEIPSKALYKRLYAAEDYLKKNPHTTAVLSGGQGPGETVTEAKAMEQYLLSKGISKHRLRTEDKSTDTVENMKFSQAFLSDKNVSVGVVTNDFHVYRGVAVGKKLGYTQIYGIPASSDMILQVNYLVRESFAVIKDKAAGNI
ncbi:YdcF family protein [Lactonifactor longoviformis]|uniref:YdcF family protein n=1 Tax=Lactonifactor longoviformis TaxID=341220 RepID=UPI001D02CDDE|nr:YdcF family protein [Lactonifactor longoviformis]MCB5714986.1 YdcF family protein [Lactonifactor longoviformis]MCB5718940.1 YdcF family protein [Lactonifactor longoviformis]